MSFSVVVALLHSDDMKDRRVFWSVIVAIWTGHYLLLLLIIYYCWNISIENDVIN